MKTLRIAVAGLGNVGLGVLSLLRANRDVIASRTGCFLDVVAVSARDRTKDRGISFDNMKWLDHPSLLAELPEVDVVVEAIGGENDPALSLVQKALAAGKDVVTANKALLAHHGKELACAAEEAGKSLKFEAAVAGGIPLIKMLREGLAANRISGLYGILNGTCNYILTSMEASGRSFGDVLSEAQKQGYAEADPTLDIDGGDTAHKLCLLTSLVFGVSPDLPELSVQGIRRISLADIRAASELGYSIKLLGCAFQESGGEIFRFVGPAMVPLASPLSHVTGAMNAVSMMGDFIGPSFIEGKGAGAGPTASAIVADLIDLAMGRKTPVFGLPVANLQKASWANVAAWGGKFFLRVEVKDQVGVIADLAKILRDEGISIETLVQKAQAVNQPVVVLITTHDTTWGQIDLAMARVGQLGSVAGPPLVLPMLNI